MKLRIVVFPEAKIEALEAARWYATADVEQGEAFLLSLDNALERISRYPERYPAWRRGLPYRRALLPHFPYLVFYAVNEDAVEVQAIAHTSRRPGYWLKR